MNASTSRKLSTRAADAPRRAKGEIAQKSAEPSESVAPNRGVSSSRADPDGRCRCLEKRASGQRLVLCRRGTARTRRRKNRAEFDVWRGSTLEDIVTRLPRLLSLCWPLPIFCHIHGVSRYTPVVLRKPATESDPLVPSFCNASLQSLFCCPRVVRHVLCCSLSVKESHGSQK